VPANRLAKETSPYLLQHAHNPVDWYPWGPEALARAVAEDRPILLSIGYSACHWCHVMERESFENDEIAALMNRDFVCIKVDREERPDLDQIYMSAVQAFTGGRGGWPMTVFLTPSGQPFFGGTYFPPVAGRGMPSFPQVMAHATKIYSEDKDKLDETTRQLQDYLAQSGRLPAPDAALTADWLDRIADAAADDFDARDGGFGGAPKFPPHATLAALLAHWRLSNSPRSLRMVRRTLDAMAKGGMYDHLGGGFARYSVDGEWRIPHFEKMLYDNAQLVPVYLDTAVATGSAHYRRVVVETLDYVLREMTHAEGGFCSAQDADSEGVEGKFYAWTPAELRDVLGVLDGVRVATLLQVTEAGTFEHGTSALRLEEPLETLSEADRALLTDALPKLKAVRDHRIWPGRDDKVLTAWNALMISAFARAGAALERPDYIRAAEASARFIEGTLVRDGRLLRTWKDGTAHLLAYADDHALLVTACLDLYSATFDGHWLARAHHWADVLVDLFWDDQAAGFFFTGRDADALITRSKHMLGGAEPSPNGAAALAFARLAVLSGRDDLGRRADEILACYQPLLARAPRALGLEALAAAWRTRGTQELAILGDAPESLLAAYRARYLPLSVVAVAQGPDPLLPWLDGRKSPDGAATAWLCENFSCQLPTQDPAELAAQLERAAAPSERARPTGRDHAPALPIEPEAWLNVDTDLPGLSELKGRITVLDFWTYCCINCLHVLPELAAVEAHYADDPVLVIGVHSAKFPTERERDSVASAIARHQITHPVVLDPDHTLWEQFTVKSWPTVMVLDATGRIAWRHSGEVDRDTLIGVIDDLIAEGGLSQESVWRPPVRETSTAGLRHPGKLHISPGAAAQQVGHDPFGPEARLFVADTGHHRILECTLERDDAGWPVATLRRTFGSGEPGWTDGRATQARFRSPQGMDATAESLFVADTDNHVIRAIDLALGDVRTVAGTGELGRRNQGDPRRPRTLPLRSPWDIAVASEGSGAASPQGDIVFIAMAGTHQIWAYLPQSDRIQPVAGSGREDHVDGPAMEAAFAQPSGLELFGRYLFVADSEVSSVRAFDLVEHKVGTLVGQGLFDWGDVDGAGADVRLQHALGVTAADHYVYVADTFNHKIKRIDLSAGQTTTLAGGPGVLAEPGGIARAGDFLLVPDTNHHRIVAVHRDSGELRPLEIDGLC